MTLAVNLDFFSRAKINSKEEADAIILAKKRELAQKGLFSFDRSIKENISTMICSYGVRCPHCNSDYTEHSSYGTSSSSTKKYLCTSCGAYFLEGSNSVFHYVHKLDLFFDHLILMGAGVFTLDFAQKYFGISRKTALDYRHKAFTAMGESPQEGKTLIGEFFMTFSHKGGSDRGCEVQNAPDSKVGISLSPGGEMNLKRGEASLENAVMTKERDNRKISEADLQKVKEALNFFIWTLFRGVSTRYLNSYLAWFSWLCFHSANVNSTRMLFSRTVAWKKFRRVADAEITQLVG